MNRFPVKLAGRYIFSGKNAIEVNVITWIAFLALGFVTTCLVVILSIFSGLEDVNLKFYSDINPDIKITPAQGKVIANADEVISKISSLQDVYVATPVIEERAFIRYHDKNHIVMMKGVKNSINEIFPLDSMVRIGSPLDEQYPDEIIIGANVSNKLSLFLDDSTPVELFVPKPGKNLIQSADDAFNAVQVFSTGLFFINDKFDNHIFTHLSTAQKLLNYPQDSYSAIEVEAGASPSSAVVRQIKDVLGEEYTVRTRQELDSAFLKMMNTENLIIYLILVLILIIASFNLAGGIAILILDKRPAISTLHNMGMKKKDLRLTFFYTGLMVTLLALITGVTLGSLLALGQYTYGWVRVSQFVAFPVKFLVSNYLITIGSVLAIGVLVSWFVSRKTLEN
ncbi:MAG: FtsX-like permease family protein [Weeksellaceae bacterium]|nr:FtsX-like permease family protein [Weeksellaceae bacterium]